MGIPVSDRQNVNFQLEFQVTIRWGLQFRVCDIFVFSGYNFGLNCDTFGLNCFTFRLPGEERNSSLCIVEFFTSFTIPSSFDTKWYPHFQWSLHM